MTQQFNTATSMGRLTLNVLFSFAQFEREVTGERIRDKVAASKRKGLWMGGTGRSATTCVTASSSSTRPRPRRRRIYAAYLALGSVRLLEERLRADGVVGKSGRTLGRGALFHMLRNRVYRGEIAHKGAVYPGEHAAIVERELWESVHGCLAAGRSGARSGKPCRSSSPLAGILFDASGGRLTPTHAAKAGRRYRYYVSRPLVTGTRASAGDGGPVSRRRGGGARHHPAAPSARRPGCAVRGYSATMWIRALILIAVQQSCQPVSHAQAITSAYWPLGWWP